MQATNFLTSSCRYCRYYQGQGRRGGTCQQLNVPVDAHWKACALAARPFHNEWQELDDFVRLEQSLAVSCPIYPAPVSPSRNAPRQPIAV
ncbi:hypothetical protein V0288_06570 [Pannus brasiliensis CCIBt3594]|uniref:Uncharacterized protein n=1 Tax=Pannus brasiliensis CCIBt3594 TaxID=1427578 RepID=A0AAW9QV30_9CHRO